MRLVAFLGTLDERELIELSIAHLRRIGVNLIVVYDYGSTDGTIEAVGALQATADVWLFHVPPEQPYEVWNEVEIELARSVGADWAIFLDTDEFWLPASGWLPDALADSAADALVVPRYNLALQDSSWSPNLADFDSAGYDRLRLYTRGPDEWEDGLVGLDEYLDQHPEESWIRGGGREPKIAVRPERLVRLHDGHHDADLGPDASWSKAFATDVVIAHAPFTTESRFERKVHNIRRSVESHPEWFINERAWQWMRWLRLADEGRLRDEFERQFLAGERIEELARQGAVKTVAQLLGTTAAATDPGTHERGPVEQRDGDAATAWHGAFGLDPTIPASPGSNAAEQLLTDALLREGPLGAGLRALLGEWWSACIHALESDGRQIEFAPTTFEVDGDGRWTHRPQPWVSRFRYPDTTLAAHGLFGLLSGDAATQALPGMSPTTPLRDGLAGLLGSIGLDFDDAAIALWLDFETDLGRAVDGSSSDRAARRAALAAVADGPVASRMAAAEMVGHYQAALAEAERRLEASNERALGAEKIRDELQRRVGALESRRRHAEQRVAEAERQRGALRAALAEAQTQHQRQKERAEALEKQVSALSRPQTPPATAPATAPTTAPVTAPSAAAPPSAGRASIIARARAILARRRGSNPLRGRAPDALLDPAWYAERYPDVAGSGMEPVDHYYWYGAAEGRDPGPGFDTRWYLAHNPDVAASGVNPLQHYLENGRSEGRAPRAPATS